MDILSISILGSIIGTISGMISGYLTTYFNKKAEYKVMKDQIGGITVEIENAKHTFTEQTENLKKTLSVLTNKENVLFSEEKEALVAYLGAWNVWYSNIKSITRESTSKEYKDIYDVIKGIEILMTKKSDNADNIETCVSKLELFLNNEEILKSINILNETTESFQTLNDEYIQSFIWHNHNQNNYLNQLLENKSQADNDGILSSMEQLRKKLESLQNNYHTQMVNIRNEMFKARIDFIKLSRSYIRKDI